MKYLNLNYNKNNIILNLNYYFYTLLLIGIYYLTPSIQFILYQSKDKKIKCYFNELCSHKLGDITSFNNVISNIFYILYGIIFIITVKLKKFNIDIIDENNEQNTVRHNYSTGIYENKSLYYSLGLALIFEGVSSSLYHLCPSKLNLQFDTTFMFIGLALCFLILYHKRNIGELCSSLKFFLIIHLIIILNIFSLSENKNNTHFWIWLVSFLLAIYCVICLTLHVYFDIDNNLEFSEALILIKNVNKNELIRNYKFWIVFFTNFFTIGICIYAGLGNINFTHWILFLEVFNLIIYFLYYILQKILRNEKIRLYIKIGLILNLCFSVSSLYFFFKSNTNIMLTYEESKELNDYCIIFNYFDNHDLWHILSATAIYVFMNIVLYIDYDIEYNIEEIISFF